MGTVTSTIGSSGRDYSTIQAWEDAIPADCVAAANSYVGQCYNDSEFVVSAQINISAHTTSSTYTIKLTTASGQSFSDNTNVQTNALRYNQSNGVAIRNNGSVNWTQLFLISNDYVTVENVQITISVAGDHLSVMAFYGGGNYLKNCIIYIGGPNYGGGDIRCVVSNCLFIMNSAASMNCIYSGGGTACYGVTFVQPTDSTDYGTCTAYTPAWNNSAIVKNCAFFGFGTCIGNDSNTVTVTNCATDKASFGTSVVEAGTNQKSKTYSNQFQNTTIASGDYRLKTGSDCIDTGVTEATYMSTDIAGTSRPQGGAYDIGCWEKVVPPNPRLGDFFFVGP